MLLDYWSESISFTVVSIKHSSFGSVTAVSSASIIGSVVTTWKLPSDGVKACRLSNTFSMWFGIWSASILEDKMISSKNVFGTSATWYSCEVPGLPSASVTWKTRPGGNMGGGGASDMASVSQWVFRQAPGI